MRVRNSFVFALFVALFVLASLLDATNAWASGDRYRGDQPTRSEVVHAYHYAERCGGRVVIEPLPHRTYDIVVEGCKGR